MPLGHNNFAAVALNKFGSSQVFLKSWFLFQASKWERKREREREKLTETSKGNTSERQAREAKDKQELKSETSEDHLLSLGEI